MTSPRVRHPLNAPGSFYVELGCCTACMAPHEVAPGVMGMGPDGHCFIAWQPDDDAGTYQALRAIAVADLGCIRYGGEDASILARLAAMGEGAVCDHAPPADADTSPRTHLSVAAPFPDAWAAAVAVREALGRLRTVVMRVQEPRAEGSEVVLGLTLGVEQPPLRISADPRRPGRWVITTGEAEPVAFGLGMLVDDSLRDDGRFSDLRWYTTAEWLEGAAEGSPWPF